MGTKYLGWSKLVLFLSDAIKHVDGRCVEGGEFVGDVIKILERETDGKSFKSYKYCHDTAERAGIEYDDNNNVEWKNYGETEKHKSPINLKQEADARKQLPSIFTYFLDGSRHTYKIDDMSYNKNVYPVLAGQIGVGCCKRVNKELSPALPFCRRMVIVLPNIAFRDEWDERVLSDNLLKKVNANPALSNYFKVGFDEILTYKRDKDEKHEKKGIAVIQDYMIALEKDTVAELVVAGKLDQDHYLIKDGSIDYQKVSAAKNKNAKNLSDQRIAYYYKYVIGVSKSFDPTKCFVKAGGSNSDIIANLKPFERTPAFMYCSERAGNVHFCIWYLRLREAKYTQSVFDGIVKIEKLVVNEQEQENGVASDEIDNISAYLLNERNPVCYGTDARWANHIYPIYLTELFIKSKYLSNNLFMHLF